MKNILIQVIIVFLSWLVLIGFLRLFPGIVLPDNKVNGTLASSPQDSVSPPSLASAIASTKTPMDPCDIYISKFCGPPDEPGRGGCIIANRDKIPENCSHHVKSNLDAYAVCENDIKKHCASVPFGRGRQLKCLWDHEKEISEQCYYFVKARRKLFQ